MVYTFDRSRGLVKIIKRGNVWAVYRIKEIQEREKVFADPMRMSEKRYKFVFEARAIATHSYKPFEDRDVSNNPDSFVEDVRTWQPYTIHLI